MVRWIFLLMVDVGEDITRNSVFESLIFSLFFLIHDRMSDMQPFSIVFFFCLLSVRQIPLKLFKHLKAEKKGVSEPIIFHAEIWIFKDCATQHMLTE